jgi:hypothetical protein
MKLSLEALKSFAINAEKNAQSCTAGDQMNARRNTVRVADLPSEPEYGVCLHCPGCSAEYSAHRGDYFLSRPDEILKCNHPAGLGRARNLRLVRKHTYLEAM